MVEYRKKDPDDVVVLYVFVAKAYYRITPSLLILGSGLWFVLTEL